MKLFEINLLPKKKNKVADKLLHFILYYFRYIIVITQIVVIGVFFFRFRVDQGVIDLKESFKQKQQILAVTIPIVEEAKEVELKTNQIQVVLDQEEEFLARLNFLVKSIPRDVTLQRLDILDQEIIVEGESVNVFSIRSLHRKIAMSQGLESAEIVSIEREADNSFHFLIKVRLQTDEKN
jgi:Tfp pilus assembly protein PilN